MIGVRRFSRLQRRRRLQRLLQLFQLSQLHLHQRRAFHQLELIWIKWWRDTSKTWGQMLITPRYLPPSWLLILSSDSELSETATNTLLSVVSKLALIPMRCFRIHPLQLKSIATPESKLLYIYVFFDQHTTTSVSPSVYWRLLCPFLQRRFAPAQEMQTEGGVTRKQMLTFFRWDRVFFCFGHSSWRICLSRKYIINRCSNVHLSVLFCWYGVLRLNSIDWCHWDCMDVMWHTLVDDYWLVMRALFAASAVRCWWLQKPKIWW